MPLVRIDVSRTAPSELGRRLGDIVHEAMVATINVPADDRFQIITSHDAGELVRPASYLGIEYSDGIVFIQITLNQGRTVEMKKALYAQIAGQAQQKLGLRRQDVVISLVEVAKENWSFGNGEMQYG